MFRSHQRFPKLGSSSVPFEPQVRHRLQSHSWDRCKQPFALFLHLSTLRLLRHSLGHRNRPATCLITYFYLLALSQACGPPTEHFSCDLPLSSLPLLRSQIVQHPLDFVVRSGEWLVPYLSLFRDRFWSSWWDYYWTYFQLALPFVIQSAFDAL